MPQVGLLGLSQDLIISRSPLGLFYGFSCHYLWKEGLGIVLVINSSLISQPPTVFHHHLAFCIYEQADLLPQRYINVKQISGLLKRNICISVPRLWEGAIPLNPATRIMIWVLPDLQ